MSISRVKPASWAFGEKLTAAQMNTLDTNVSTATQDAQRHGAVYDVTGTGVTNGSKCTLTLEERSDTGYVLASDEVTVPEAGWYLIGFCGLWTSAGTSNPQGSTITVRSPAGTIIMSIEGIRYNATAGDNIRGSAQRIKQIVTPASEKISVVNSDSNNITLATPAAGVIVSGLTICRIA